MSRTIAIRVSDDAYSALEAQCKATGQTMTQLVTPIILGMIELPAAPLSPIEQRLLVIEDRMLAIDKLETQMVDVIDRLDRDKTHPIAPPLDTGLELVGLVVSVAIDSKISPESSRDLDKGGTSTSLELVTIDPDVCRAIISVLRPYPDSGYYFRSEYLGQTKISHSYRQQAIKMGFSSESIRIDGKQFRVWLNRDYCLQSANT